MTYFVRGMHAYDPPYCESDGEIICIGPVKHLDELLSAISTVLSTDLVEWIEIEWEKENAPVK